MRHACRRPTMSPALPPSFPCMQVGAQDVAMGIKFSAAVTVECTEFITGLPLDFCSTSNDGSDGLLPRPKLCLEGVPTRDITFVQTEGDFEVSPPPLSHP
jgi:hypothetical protein